MADDATDIDRLPTNTEHHLRTLINNIDDPIWLVDLDCNIVECNKAFGKWVACFIDVELTKGDHVLYNGKNTAYKDKYEMCYQLALNGRAFKSVEDVRVGEELQYTSVTFNPVFEDGKVKGVNCYARDITEQRKHLLKIEEQNTALREIAFIESHKVRAPVANILGLQQLFNHHDFTDPINQVVIEGIAKTVNDLDVIIREVVRMSNDIVMQD